MVALCIKRVKIRKAKKIFRRYAPYVLNEPDRFIELGLCKLKAGDVIGACNKTNERIKFVHREIYKGLLMSIHIETEQAQSCGGMMDYMHCVRDIPYEFDKCVFHWKRYAEYLVKVGNEEQNERLLKKGGSILYLLATNNLLDSEGVIKKEHEHLGEGEYVEIK